MNTCELLNTSHSSTKCVTVHNTLLLSNNCFTCHVITFLFCKPRIIRLCIKWQYFIFLQHSKFHMIKSYAQFRFATKCFSSLNFKTFTIYGNMWVSRVKHNWENCLNLAHTTMKSKVKRFVKNRYCMKKIICYKWMDQFQWYEQAC